MGVFRVRLNRSAQSGSARQVLQSLQGVGQTRVMGDMVHMVESCVNDFWALSTVLATRHSSLNLSLRHEVARLIVWHAVSTRPVVGAADKAARLMRCKSSVVNCLVRTTSIFGTCEGNNTGGARMEKPRLLYGICRSGRGDLGGEQTRRPERIRNGNDLEIWSAVQSLSGGMRESRPMWNSVGKADDVREETGMCT